MKAVARFLSALVVALAVGSWPEPVRSEDSGATPAARGSVLVVADVASDMTDNAKIRAQAYEAARRRGLEADRKADVQGTAQRTGAMEAGVLTRDDAKLGALRTALGVTVLVRVAREWEQATSIGVTVTVVNESGARSKIVQAPKGGAGDAAVAALEQLLDESVASPAAAPPARPGAPAATDAAVAPPAGDAKGQGSGWLVFSGQTNVQEDEKTMQDAKTRREAWERRGGPQPTYEARAVVTGIRIADIDYSDTNPVTGEIDEGTGDALGIGGGVALRGGLMILPLPEPTTSKGKVFAAFRLGAGGDLSFVFVRRPIGFAYEQTGADAGKRKEDQENETLLFANVPLQVGIHFGFGRFHTNSIWRGVVLGFAYTPTLQLEVNLDRAFGGDEEGGRKSDTRFNYGGAEVMLDIASIEAGPSKHDPEPQIRVAAQVLPPIESDWPLVVNLGIGAAWY